ncbi:MAG: hypothetical protein AABX51_04400 [Nanoarchaeota archaeon]
MPIQTLVKGEFQKKLLQPRILIPILIAFFVLFFFVIPQWKEIRNIFFITVFFVLGCLSYFYRRFFNVRIGIEFISVGTFLCTLAYGVGVGLFIGNATSFIAEIIRARVDERIIINILSINGLILITPFLAGLATSNLLIAALIANFVYNLIGVGGNMLLGGNPGKTIVFVSTNVFWTLAFFLRIGPLVYIAMTG